jgi:hypothetical protein
MRKDGILMLKGVDGANRQPPFGLDYSPTFIWKLSFVRRFLTKIRCRNSIRIDHRYKSRPHLIRISLVCLLCQWSRTSFPLRLDLQTPLSTRGFACLESVFRTDTNVASAKTPGQKLNRSANEAQSLYLLICPGDTPVLCSCTEFCAHAIPSSPVGAILRAGRKPCRGA